MAELEEWVGAVTGAQEVRRGRTIQTLWSGYGEIFRAALDDGRTVIVKDVRPPTDGAHPRGWNTDRGHHRKLASYAVERVWYDTWADRCSDACRVPRCFATRADETGWTFVLEDLDAAGFGGRRGSLDAGELEQCIDWLAHFHATYLGADPDGLWTVGTYWHLDTRPDELLAMPDGPLKEAAEAIDRRLTDTRFSTIVHGDAKFANFCFGDGDVAAVDFQYVGGGCGMKDVAYFLSCLSSRACEASADALLERYFGTLRTARPDADHDALEVEWRALYPFAWADFSRFLAGWSPGHWKLSDYAERMTAAALASV